MGNYQPQALVEALRDNTPDLRVKFGKDNPTLYTFGFKNRDGRLGLLQVTGFTDNPRGVRVRYKLVQNATPPAAIVPPKIAFGPRG